MDLLSLVPVKRSVAIGADTLDVAGLSLESLAALCVRFPPLLKLFGTGEYNPFEIIASGASAAIIATALGHANSDKAEDVARALPAKAQIDILLEAITLTFPGGAGPFAASLGQIVNVLNGGSEEEARSETLPNALISSSEPDTALQP